MDIGNPETRHLQHGKRVKEYRRQNLVVNPVLNGCHSRRDTNQSELRYVQQAYEG